MTTKTPPPEEPIASTELSAPLKTVQDTAASFSSDTVTWLQDSTWHALAVFGAAIACGFILRFMRSFILKRIAKGGEESLSGGVRLVIYRLVKNTSVIFLTVLGFWMMSLFIALPKGVQSGFDFAFMITGVIQAGMIAREVLLLLIERRLWHSGVQGGDTPVASAIGVMGWLVNLGVWSITFLLLLDNLGVNVTALVAGLGIGGLAIGLAAQGIISDLFSALSIVFDRPFVKGDFIIFGTKSGSVEKVGLKTTRIRALSGEMIVVSNNQLLGDVIHNYRQMQERRSVFRIGVVHSTPIEALEAAPLLLRKAIEEDTNCRFDRAHLCGVGESSIDFEIVYYFKGRDYAPYMDSHQAILLRIMRSFAANGLEFAFPTRTVHLVSDTRVASGAA